MINLDHTIIPTGLYTQRNLTFVVGNRGTKSLQLNFPTWPRDNGKTRRFSWRAEEEVITTSIFVTTSQSAG